MRRYLLACAAATLFAAPLAAQVTITTGTPNTYVGPLGRDSELGSIPTAVAQTFFAPAGTNRLQSFNLFITNFFGGSGLLLDASVYQFSTDHLIGTALFTTQLTGTNSLSDLLLSFGSAASPINAPLTSGAMYAFVLSAADRYQSSPNGSSILFGGVSTNAYSNGSLFFSMANSAGALQSDGAFVPVDGAPDAAFTATFTNVTVIPPVTPTPEPATFALFAVGLMVLGVISVRRKRV